MSTSGSYTFSPTIDDIITDAYERCGIDQSNITAQMYTSSLFSLNGVLAELTNMQLNLWEVEPIIVSITGGQNTYQLPDGTIDVLEAYRRSFTRVLAGTAASSAGGTASYAFDGLTATSCTQTSTNGNISYDYGAGTTQVITMVGYQATAVQTLMLVYEGSNDNSNWLSILTKTSQSYPAGQIVWDVIQNQGAYRYYRVRETGGGTLNPEEVYFCNDERDYPLGRMSRYEYDGINTKSQSGIPVSFYIERSTVPYMHIYMTPDDQFTMIKANRIRQLQTVSGASQTLDAPFRFIEVMTAGLAVKLAVKKAPERIQMLTDQAAFSLKNAQTEDRERVNASFVPDMSGYRIQ